MKADPVAEVFETWRTGHSSPGRVRFTPDRKKLIQTRLKSFSVEDLCSVIQYAYEADTPAARFWRGDNRDGRTYLDMENLFRASKLSGRVEDALAWLAGEDPDDPDGPADQDDGLDLGPMGAFRSGAATTRRPEKPKRAKPKPTVRGRTPSRNW